jgi:RHS repeat-associated protein
MNGHRDSRDRPPAAAPAGTTLADGAQGSGRPPLFESIFAPPAVTLPKGGGALRGIGEKFAVNAATGTASFSVPVATSPGRSGFGPQLSLSYDSGSGAGAFGLGWNLGIPAITRQTDKGIPRYLAPGSEGEDVYVLAGAEDLVPELRRVDGRWERRRRYRTLPDNSSWEIERYRPRLEGLFARIERWTNRGSGETRWRTISRDNVTSWYGTRPESRIAADPADPSRVFSWLLCESYDDRGNAILYRYKEEDSARVDVSLAHERNRTAASRSRQRYLKRICYGNRTPRAPDEDLTTRADWMFEAVLDYGEHPGEAPLRTEDRPWDVRHDPWSSYRSGFEVRTYRRCRRVLCFHHFPAEADVGQSCLVRSTELAYRDPSAAPDGHPTASLLASVTHVGYRRRADGSYARRAYPPVEFEYSEPTIDEQVRELSAAAAGNQLRGVPGHRQWLDLDGEGLPGLLAIRAGGWQYERNVSSDGIARLDAPELLPSVPTITDAPATTRLLDLAGDGSTDLVRLGPPPAGFHERTPDGSWSAMTAFADLPNIDWSDANLRFVDLTGDGRADALLLTGDDGLTWYASLGEDGFAPAARAPVAADEEAGPRVLFADGTQSILLLDMSGDGLNDIARLRNGEVVYWPNVGYGRFGPKVTMDDSPWFDAPDSFDPRRVRFGDIDGSGTIDLIYLAADEVRIYFNRFGNGWTAPRRLTGLPVPDSHTIVEVEDLLGNGTACLLYSSTLGTDQPTRYVDLMGGHKPHLLVRVITNLGAETRISYAASTRFYLADRAASRPWATRLPFPVQVVERVEVHDHVSHNRFVTRYAYHHGYFDAERELRGFGMVEQWDTEELGALGGQGTAAPATNFDASSNVPPVLTRSWFHTGAYAEGAPISRALAREYWAEPGARMSLEDTVLPATVWLDDGTQIAHALTPDEAREAARALKGSLLRQEVYARDDTLASDRPYSVAESSFALELLQPRGPNAHAVLLLHPRETLLATYEREPADPRIEHIATLASDRFGNLLRSATVHYGRRLAAQEPFFTAEDHAAQRQLLVTCTEHDYTRAVDDEDAYRAPLEAESRAYELLQLAPDAATPGTTNLFGFDELRTKVARAGDGAHDLPYEDVRGSGAQPGHPWRRMLEQSRKLYRRNDLTGPLPLGELQSRALPYRSYRLALTAGLVAQIFRRPRAGTTEDLLPNAAAVVAEGGYVRSDDEKLAGRFPATDPSDRWWIPSNEILYAPAPHDTPARELAYARQHFFLPHRFRDPFGRVSSLAYDAHDLLVRDTVDALGNRVTVGERSAAGALLAHGHDYRTLQPRLLTDPNRNRAAVAYDALGLVAGTAVMGKRGTTVGDSLAGFEPDLTEAQIEAYVADPLASPHTLLARASTRHVYDLRAYVRTRAAAQPQPIAACTLARETHDSELPAGALTRIQHRVSYSDGIGRGIQNKTQAEPGPLVDRGPPVSPRWVGSGWTVYDNKGLVVREYEPFFSATAGFEFARAVGVGRIELRDPLGRVVATLHPNHSYEKAVFDPWRQELWDVHDTVLVSDPTMDPDVGHLLARLDPAQVTPTWYDRRINGALGQREREAAEKAAEHRRTPTIAHVDVLGRTFISVAHNRFVRDGAVVEQRMTTRVRNDIQGYQREIVDAKGRVALRYEYDLLGTRLRVSAMDGGERWGVNDVLGEPIRSWDSRGQTLRRTYDALRRPVDLYVTGEDGVERLVERRTYGEGLSNAETDNLRGRIFEIRDGTGLAMTGPYDFKGNLLRERRRLAVAYQQTIDWLQPPALEAREYTTLITYDALDRPITRTTPDGSVIRPTFNEADLLERLEVDVRGAGVATVVLASATYDAKGRRVAVEHGNGARTTSDYDRETSLLVRTRTTREPGFPGDCPQPPGPPCGVQDLQYTFDAAGNVTHVGNGAQQVIYFANRRVDPDADYTYDAFYRLIEARGREHLGQAAAPVPTDDTDAPRVGLVHPSDGNLLGRYVERYVYDEVDGLLELAHRGEDPAHPGWRRTFAYQEPSSIEPGKMGNRLTSTRIGSGPPLPYSYDAHGNTITMPHLPLMRWDHYDRLRASARQAVASGATPETTYQVFGISGRRMRKVTDRFAAAGATSTRLKERLYLGELEIHREYDGTGTTITLERETLRLGDDEGTLALIETRTQGNDGSPARLVRHRMPDRLGSTTLELDDNRQVISYEEYYPYGGTAYRAARSKLETPNRYRWADKERDDETGFYYHGVRHYAPWLCRWVSADPGGPAGGLNLYCYGRANPITNTDPDGANPWTSMAKKVHVTPKPHGTGGIYKEMKKAPSIWEHGIRVAEDEHAFDFGSQKRTIRVSETSDVPAVTRKDYREQWTLRTPEDMARRKTADDLRIQRSLDEARKTGKVSDELAKETSPQGLIERMKRARDATRAEREAAGKSTKDLDLITDEAIERDAALQVASLHGAGKRQSWKFLSPATSKEIDDALKTLESGGKVGMGAVLLLALTAGAEAQASTGSATTPGATAAPPARASDAPPPNYMDTVHRQLQVSNQVSQVLIEESPSDALMYAGVAFTAKLAYQAHQHNMAQLQTYNNPNMALLENEPFAFNRKTGQLYKFGFGGEFEPVATLSRFGNIWGGGDNYVVWEQGGKFYIMPRN